jgi:hypothetical protein
MTYTLETMYEVWDDGSGSHIEIGPDRDGLDLVEIRSFEPKGNEPTDRIVMTKEQAQMVARALSLAAEAREP